MTSIILFAPSRPIKNGSYQSLFQAMAPLGRVVEVPLNYRASPIEWPKQLMAVYGSYNPQETILAGHWFGAWTALMCAAPRNPQALVLFSLPPLFSNDLETMSKQTLRLLDLRPDMHDVFSGTAFSEIAKEILCPTWLFVGSNESQASQRRTLEATNNLQTVSRHITSGTNNDVAKSRSSYLAEVRRTCSAIQL